MALYLVQHGQCHSKDVDPDKGLTEEGRATATRIADVAKGYGVPVNGILHSGKKRARQTAEIFEAALTPPEGLHAKSGLGPLDDVTALAGLIDSKDNLMLVGHLPFMSRLCSWLVTGDPEMPVFQFQNAGIVCLKRLPDTNSWIIAWTLMPAIG
jgi:phosphohistidine phosphatase